MTLNVPEIEKSVLTDRDELVSDIFKSIHKDPIFKIGFFFHSTKTSCLKIIYEIMAYYRIKVLIKNLKHFRKFFVAQPIYHVFIHKTRIVSPGKVLTASKSANHEPSFSLHRNRLFTNNNLEVHFPDVI